MYLQRALLLLLSLTINLTNVVASMPPESSFSKDEHKQNNAQKGPVIQLQQNEAQSNVIANNSSASQHENITNNFAANSNPKFPHGSDDLMQSGAIQRAFYVLLGGTLLLLIFLGFRMYRLQKGGSKPSVMVRKYGVLANRRDVEMLPLPLDEDDEDDTVFEVNNQIENHS